MGTVEEGGTCTLTLTRESTTVTTARPAVPNASSTSCGDLTVAPQKLAPGTWTTVLSYSSPTSAGSSPASQVKVP